MGTALADPHHDGSALYLLERPDEPGEEAVVRLRTRRELAPDGVHLRYVRDGEPRIVQATLDEESETEAWWLARFPVWNPSTRYRWLLSGGRSGYTWVNGAGRFGRDVADADDFVLPLDPGGPEWHLDSVVYEIFPDRFASSGLEAEAPSWALRRGWDELPSGRRGETQFELFGGDLRGIEQHLDHVEQLGATVLYLTPFFPAASTHRYNATSFERVDPLLGGDEALESLARAAHARGLRLLGDLTTNHTGLDHDWFVAAGAGPDAGERPFYFFDERLPGGYDSWLGHRTLPKLDWSAPELRRRMERVARRWLEAGLDGWRVDVANMTGRRNADELNLEVARILRGAVGDALLVAEHGHDYRADVPGGGWHGVMNYAGFLRPVWTWLRADEVPEPLASAFWGVPVELPRLDGEAMAATMRAFRAGVPWSVTQHSWTLLDSHDTARFRTVVGSREAHVAGVGLQMTLPGVPMVFAGDELGLEGAWGEDARRTMPWARRETWDDALHDAYRRLIALRRSEPALARGGCREAYVDADCYAYLRELPGDRLLCLASRGDHAPVRLPATLLGAGRLETLYGDDARAEDGELHLPAAGPSFHVWRLLDG